LAHGDLAPLGIARDSSVPVLGKGKKRGRRYKDFIKTEGGRPPWGKARALE
jgi:hypothetical protein